MDLTIVLIFVLAFLLASLFLRKKRNLPPGYTGIPFIGSVSFIRKLYGQRPHIAFYEEAKKLGRVYSFYFGQQFIVVLSGYDVIHEALVVKKETFSERPTFRSNVIQSALSKDFRDGGIIFRKYDTPWRESRRFTLQALRDFGVGKSSLEDKITGEINAVGSKFDSLKGEPTSVNDLMQKVVANVMFNIVFGKRYEFDDPEFDRLRGLTNTVVTGSGALTPANFLPSFIARLINRKESDIDKIRKQAIIEMRDYVFDEIAEHENSFDDSNIRDFIDIYIQTSKSEGNELKKFITKSNMFRIIIDLFLAGSETTSTSLDWAFLFMIEFPEVQKRCREEISREIGDKSVQYSDRNKLPYVNAVLMEIQRRATIIPLNVAHCTNKDTMLDGYDIPQGTLIIPSLYSVSMDEKYFEDPLKFNPDRFIDAQGKLIKNEAVLPFSAGPRTCLGEPLARLELFLIVVNLIQKFKFDREDPNAPHSLEPKQGQITNAPLSYKLRATRIL